MYNNEDLIITFKIYCKSKLKSISLLIILCDNDKLYILSPYWGNLTSEFIICSLSIIKINIYSITEINAYTDFQGGIQ